MKTINLMMIICLLATGCQTKHLWVTNFTETINPLPPGVYLDFKNNNQDRDCFLPYEEVSVKLVFKDNLYEKLIDKKFSKVLFSNKSLLNEKQYSSSELEKMLVNGFRRGDKKGVSWYHSFGKGGIIPRTPGLHKLDLIIKTPVGLWRIPTKYVSIYLPEEDNASYERFLSLQCDNFLNHPFGMRRTGTEDIATNYYNILTFLKEFPNSALVNPIAQRALRSWESDCQKKPDFFNPEDRTSVAKIIALTKKDYVLKNCKHFIQTFKSKLKTCSEKDKQYYENKIIARQRWINLLTD